MSGADLEACISFMRGELKTREESYPLRVKMGRMTEKEAAESISDIGGVVKALIYFRNPAKDRYSLIEPTLLQIHICAHEHANESVHLDAIAKVLEEIFASAEKS